MDNTYMKYKFMDVPGLDPILQKRQAERASSNSEMKLVSKLLDFFMAE